MTDTPVLVLRGGLHGGVVDSHVVDCRNIAHVRCCRDQRILMPAIFVCCVIGAFVVNNRIFDVKLMFFFGILGVALSYMKYPSAPFLLGVILGNMADENLRRALILHNGSLLPFITRPISIFFIVFILALVLPQFALFRKGMAAIRRSLSRKKEAA